LRLSATGQSKNNKMTGMNRIAQFGVNTRSLSMLVLGIVLLDLSHLGSWGLTLPDLNNPKIFIELNAGGPPERSKNYVDQIESLSIRQSDVTQVSSVPKSDLQPSQWNMSGTGHG
jgi:HAE1 family hydrophobic/amphiphilic exporter-1